MAPRRRVAPESTIRDPGLRPLSTANAGFNDVSNLLRYQNQFRNVVDFTDLSSTLNRFVGYLADVKASEDRLSTEGGDLAGAVVESSLKNNYKTYNEMISSLTPEQQTALRSLGPVQTRVFAEQVSKHAISNLETKLAAAVKEESEKPLINDKGEINPPPNIVGRIQQVYSETIPEYDQMYGDVPLIRNGIRNLAGSTLSAYQAKAALTEGTIRAKHNEAVYSANLAKFAIPKAASIESPEQQEEFIQSLVGKTILDEQGRMVAGLEGNVKGALTNRIATTAIALANNGHIDIANQYVTAAYEANEDKGYSLEMTEGESLVETRAMIARIKAQQEGSSKSVSDAANKDENVSTFNRILDQKVFDNPNISAKQLMDEMEQAANKGEIPGISGSMVRYYKGKDPFSIVQLSARIEKIKGIKFDPQTDAAQIAIREAGREINEPSISKAEAEINKHPDPVTRAALLDQLQDAKQKFAAIKNPSQPSPLDISTGLVRLVNQGQYSTFFYQLHTDKQKIVDTVNAEIAGRLYAQTYIGFQNQIGVINADEKLSVTEKKQKIFEAKAKYEKEWSVIDKGVEQYRQEDRDKIIKRGFETLSKWESSPNKNLVAAEVGDWLAEYKNKYGDAEYMDALQQAYQGRPHLAISLSPQTADAAFTQALTQKLMIILDKDPNAPGSKFELGLAEMLDEVKDVPQISELFKEFDFSTPEGRQQFMMNPAFYRHIKGGGATLSNKSSFSMAIERAYESFYSSNHGRTMRDILASEAVPESRPAAETRPVAETRPAAESRPVDTNKVLKQTVNERQVYRNIRQLNELTAAEKSEDPFASLRTTSTFLGEDALKFPQTAFDYNLDAKYQPFSNNWNFSGDNYPYQDFNRDVVFKAIEESVDLGVYGTPAKMDHEVSGARVGPLGVIVNLSFYKDQPKEASAIDRAVFGERTFSKNLGIPQDNYRTALYTRHLFGRDGVSFKPLVDAFKTAVPNPNTDFVAEVYSFVGVPSSAFKDGSYDAFRSDQKSKMANTHHGTDWEDFKAIWDLDAPIAANDPRIGRFEKLSGMELNDREVEGKTFKDLDVFKLYAQKQHALHRRLNGRSTPKAFTLSGSPTSRKANN